MFRFPIPFLFESESSNIEPATSYTSLLEGGDNVGDAVKKTHQDRDHETIRIRIRIRT